MATFRYLVVMSNARERNDWTDAVSAQVRAERAASGLTADALADRAGMSRMTYRRIAAADRVPDMAQIERICDALGIRVSTFIARVEERRSGKATPEPAEVQPEEPATSQAQRSPRSRG